MSLSRMSTTLHRVFAALTILGIIAATSLSMRAQESPGKVLGTVKDSEGAAIVGVEVALINSQGAILRTTITDAEGSFMLDGVAPGNYSVSVARRGFGHFRSAVQVLPGATKQLDVKLEVNALNDEVTVTA